MGGRPPEDAVGPVRTARDDAGRRRPRGYGVEWPRDVSREVTDLLGEVRGALKLSVALLTSFSDERQSVEIMDAAGPPPVPPDFSLPLRDTFCRAILAGELPPVINDIPNHPIASRLPPAQIAGIHSFVSVPVTFSDGHVFGTLCAMGINEDDEIVPRDQHLLELVAGLAGRMIEPVVLARRQADALEVRYARLRAAGGPRIVLQPIVELATGARTGCEALSRFPDDWGMNPEEAFAQAHAAGLGVDLEIAAVERAIPVIGGVDGYVGINASIAALHAPDFEAALGAGPAERILLEISEHDRVDDYPRLLARLDRLRARGFRLAIDDVGAGYSSLQHLVQIAPDVIKLDRSIVTGLGGDAMRHTLVGSLVDFARGCGAHLIAEGVETAADASALEGLGVQFGQGWFLGMPDDPAELDPVEGPVAPGGDAHRPPAAAEPLH